MKKAVLIISLLSFLFAVDITYNKGVLIPESLKNSFNKYWSLRADKRFYKTYQYELPYLNYLHSQEWYEDFFSTAPRIKKIKVKWVKCTKTKCKIGMILKIGKENVFYIDTWVNVDNRWYHKYNDNALPF